MGLLFARTVGTSKQRRHLPSTLYRQMATPKNNVICEANGEWRSKNDT
jgi:hypothetical protein